VVNVKKLGYISGIKANRTPASVAAHGADVAGTTEETSMATCETLLVDRPRAPG
jgi:hypothetical protein